MGQTKKRPVPEFLLEFTEGRTGWVRSQRSFDGAWMASHNVKAGEDVYAFVLTPSLTSPDLERDWNVVALFDAAVVAHYDGTFDEVTAEIIGAERTLTLIETLRQCRSHTHARLLIANVRGARLQLLRKALDLRVMNVETLKKNIIDITYGARPRAGL
jgi:hypothetical protein